MTANRNALSPINWIDQPDAVLSGENEILGREARHLATYHLGDTYRASGLAAVGDTNTVTVTFARPRAVQRVALWVPERADDSSAVDFEPRLADEDTIRWQLSDDPNVAGDVQNGGADTGFIPHGINPLWGVHDLAVDLPICRRIDLTIRAGVERAAPFDVRDIGRIWVGPVFSFAVPYGWGDTWQSDEDRYGNPIRRWRLSWRHIRNHERSELERILWQARDRRQLLLLPRADETGSAAFVRQASNSSLSSRYFNAAQLPMTFEEDVAGD